MVDGASFDLPRRRPGPNCELLTSGPRPSPGKVLVNRLGQTWLVETYRATGLAVGAAGDGAVLSPMPGRIIAVSVAAGQAVAKGQTLVTLEAMKMEHSLVAPFDGTVADLSAIEGGQVSEGALLVRIEAAAG